MYKIIILHATTAFKCKSFVFCMHYQLYMFHIFCHQKTFRKKTSFTSKLCVLSQKKKFPMYYFSFENKQIGNCITCVLLCGIAYSKKKNQYSKKNNKIVHYLV